MPSLVGSEMCIRDSCCCRRCGIIIESEVDKTTVERMVITTTRLITIMMLMQERGVRLRSHHPVLVSLSSSEEQGSTPAVLFTFASRSGAESVTTEKSGSTWASGEETKEDNDSSR